MAVTHDKMAENILVKMGSRFCCFWR